MRLLLKYLLFILLPAYTYGQSGRPDAGITFEVTDSLHNPLAYATVALTVKVNTIQLAIFYSCTFPAT